MQSQFNVRKIDVATPYRDDYDSEERYSQTTTKFATSEIKSQQNLTLTLKWKDLK